MILTQAFFLIAQAFPFSQMKAAPPPQKEAAMPAAKQTLPPAALSEKSTILIQAKARADDLVQAFETFKKEKPTYRIAARLASGGSLSDILELIPMSNGTLFIVKSSSPMGSKTQILSVDELVDFYFP